MKHQREMIVSKMEITENQRDEPMRFSVMITKENDSKL